MNENKFNKEYEFLEALQQKKQELEDNIITRRSFLEKTGKIIALGALSHFVLVGRLPAKELNKLTSQNNLNCAVGTCVTVLGEESCNQRFSCNPNTEYKCGAMTGQDDKEPEPCTNDCMISYVTDCFVGIFDTDD